MKNALKYISLAIVCAMTSSALAQPYSLCWEESNAAPSKATSEYTLGWQDTGVATAPSQGTPSAASSKVEAPVAVNLAALPALIAAATGGSESYLPGQSVALASSPVRYRQSRSLRGPSSVSVPTHDITFRAERYFDHWTDNYRYVNKVEVVTYRGGYPRTEVYENVAQYGTYVVYINDLKVGDRYEVRVTWDDGSYRIVDRSIGRHPQYNVRVTSPS